jgi:uncharacterized protein (TIGR03067 family)
MNRSCAVLVGSILIGLAAWQRGTAGDAKTEFEGTWDLIYLERDGEALKPLPNTRTVNAGGKFVVKVGEEDVAAGTFKVDPSKKPKAVDVTYTEGPDKGKSFKAIYQIDGDTAKLCRAGSPDQERPTEFKTSPGMGGFLARYKRAKE